MKVALLIAVMLASTSVVFPYWMFPRRRSSKKGVTFQEKEEALQDAAAKLEEVMHGAESESVLELMREFQEVEENDGALSGDTFEKKVATLQEAAADMEEKVNEVEEDAALGLLEEELEELEEELEEAKDDPEE
ncbi:PREDICTED: uncharacterized protein LOC109485042 isoform X2 [Branchiostoma belcheri]|nr:PREDICTED: uncharacterized protein LOC109485042 isoform X2 [Branchiostoma belcheri]XP_019644193.1 PREDICTED: uncharacterized protein LOC109485042 isoform X2 [Branchiostoma belcheri]XP_019644262.1 PREDICTED: uncharacterized protein LOC109485042 isoform X2 [Branchiostoma belcheri]XP_019644353.1 PREDICTED: uncharacterized protein LOC109485042 isoform X2 [Branchiostoma belcheri]